MNETASLKINSVLWLDGDKLRLNVGGDQISISESNANAFANLLTNYVQKRTERK